MVYCWFKFRIYFCIFNVYALQFVIYMLGMNVYIRHKEKKLDNTKKRNVTKQTKQIK